jgi:hypothetical protein
MGRPAAQPMGPAKPAPGAALKPQTTAAVQTISINPLIIAENIQGGCERICIRPDLQIVDRGSDKSGKRPLAI